MRRVLSPLSSSSQDTNHYLSYFHKITGSNVLTTESLLPGLENDSGYTLRIINSCSPWIHSTSQCFLIYLGIKLQLNL